MTEQRARAKMTFCLTRCPAKATSRLISSMDSGSLFFS